MKASRGAIPASVENLKDELRTYERTIARLGPEECSLLNRIDNLKGERANLTARLQNDWDTKALSSARNRIVAIDAELSGLVGRHDEIAPVVKNAYLRATEIRSGFRATAQGRVKDAFEGAFAGAPSRNRYVAEKSKLETLKGKLESARSELDRLRNGLHSQVSNEDARAEALLRTGEIPSAADIPTALGEVKRTAEVISVIEAAVKLQEIVFDQARSQFRGELVASLGYVREGLIQRIADGYSAAIDATQEARMLQECMGSAVGWSGEFFAFSGVHDDPDSPFSRWLAGARRAGYEI